MCAPRGLETNDETRTRPSDGPSLVTYRSGIEGTFLSGLPSSLRLRLTSVREVQVPSQDAEEIRSGRSRRPATASLRLQKLLSVRAGGDTLGPDESRKQPVSEAKTVDGCERRAQFYVTRQSTCLSQILLRYQYEIVLHHNTCIVQSKKSERNTKSTCTNNIQCQMQ